MKKLAIVLGVLTWYGAGMLGMSGIAKFKPKQEMTKFSYYAWSVAGPLVLIVSGVAYLDNLSDNSKCYKNCKQEEEYSSHQPGYVECRPFDRQYDGSLKMVCNGDFSALSDKTLESHFQSQCGKYKVKRISVEDIKVCNGMGAEKYLNCRSYHFTCK